MTVTLIKTKTEQRLLADFEQARSALPGTGWVERLRRDSIDAFGARGLPHRRIEEWKYTDLRERLTDVSVTAATSPRPIIDRKRVDRALGPLATLEAHRVVFLDGRYSADLSDTGACGVGVDVQSLGSALLAPPDWLQAEITPAQAGPPDAIAALNLAFMTDGVLLHVAADVAPSKPILIVNLRSTSGSGLVAIRNVVRVGAGARVTVIEAHAALDGGPANAHANTVTDVDVADRAAVVHVQIVADAPDSTHLAQWRVRIGERADYRAFQLTAGIKLARNELTIAFTGPDAKLDISGAFLGRGDDHIDTTLVVDHSTTACESRELFKGVLEDRARGVFQGKIIVQPEAQKTDGKQMAQVLMLSEDAEFDSKPELEIYADDVVCGHGSTVAELDPELVFYLRSRGIPLAEARAMLTESFVVEAIEKVEDEAIRGALMAIAVAWLRRKTGSKD